jgi:hypothetical protein
MEEIIDLRAKIKKLEYDAVQQFRNDGELWCGINIKLER